MCMCQCHGVICLVDCQKGVHLVDIVSVGLLITFVRVFVDVWCMYA